MKLLKGGDSFRAFAERVGVKETTAKSWFGSTVPSIEMAAKVADAYGKSLDWLYGRDDEHIPSEQVAAGLGQSSVSKMSQTIEMDGFAEQLGAARRAPFYEVKASAGNGAVVLSQRVMDYMEISSQLLPRDLPSNARIGVIQSTGDSMEPTIRDGDLLIVRFDIDRVRSDGIYVVSYDGEIRVKRLTVNPGEVVLSSDNEAHHAISMTRADAELRLTVHGQVFAFAGALRHWRK